MSLKFKKTYVQPYIDNVIIDREISLIMMTGYEDPPDPPVRGAAQQSSEFEKNTFNDSPFEEKK